jgi:hypothetical protein
MLGIEEAFDENNCCYCGEEYTGVDWRSRGDQLVSVHKFGGCNMNLSFEDTLNYVDGFEEQLIEYHAQSINIFVQIPSFSRQIESLGTQIRVSYIHDTAQQCCWHWAVTHGLLRC